MLGRVIWPITKINANDLYVHIVEIVYHITCISLTNTAVLHRVSVYRTVDLKKEAAFDSYNQDTVS